MEIKNSNPFNICSLKQSFNSVQCRNTNYPNLAPLPKDTVSFKGSLKLKKSDFEGVDLAIIEKYKPNIQQFKSKVDLQKFAEGEILKIKNKSYEARNEEINTHRRTMLKEWFDYVTIANGEYSNTQQLLILSAITKMLKNYNDSLPPVLNKGVLADTMTDLVNRLSNHSKDNFDFLKMYETKLRESVLIETNTGETESKWVIIPSKENDPEHFTENVDRLKILSHKNWCTKSFNAEPYLEKGDFHVYLENGYPKLGVRFVGDNVEEIQGEKNNGKIPIKYLDLYKQHQKEYAFDLASNAKEQLEKAEISNLELQEIKKELGTALELNNIEDACKVLNYFGFDAHINNENKLVVSEYKPLNNVSFDDLEIDENKLFRYISKISGSARFFDTNVTDLGNLEYIGGVADFGCSSVKKLGALKYIGQDAIFESSAITSLQNLEKINGSAYFSNSAVMDLGNLSEISWNAYFKNSNLKTLGNLEIIGHNVDFGESEIQDLGELSFIGCSAKFGNSKITNLKNLVKIGGDASFEYSDVVNLGKLKIIGGDADFRNVPIKNLGRLVTIGGNADFRYTDIENIGKLQDVKGKIEYDDFSVLADFAMGDLQDYANDDIFADNDNDDDFYTCDNDDIWRMIEQD